MLNDLLLAEDLLLLWFNPIDRSAAHWRGRDGVGASITVKSVGAAMLYELLTSGGAVLEHRKASRLELKALEIGMAALSTRVLAADTPPVRSELVTAWERLRKYRRPRLPERVLARLHHRPDARLVAAGMFVMQGVFPIGLTDSGLALARERRAELDGYILHGVRPEQGFAPRTLGLSVLLSITWSWRAAYRFVGESAHLQIEQRMFELRREAESGPDGEFWAVVGGGLRRATADD